MPAVPWKGSESVEPSQPGDPQNRRNRSKWPAYSRPPATQARSNRLCASTQSRNSASARKRPARLSKRPYRRWRPVWVQPFLEELRPPKAGISCGPAWVDLNHEQPNPASKLATSYAGSGGGGILRRPIWRQIVLHCNLPARRPVNPTAGGEVTLCGLSTQLS